MKKNMGLTDKTIRLIVALILVVLYLTNIISGVLGIAGLVLAAVFVITSLLNFCPLYLPFGFSTRSKDTIK